MKVENHGRDAISEAWPTEGLERCLECPVCGSENRWTLYVGLTDRIFHCAPGEWSFQQCINCETGYLDPRPTERTIQLAYRTYYTHTKKSPRRKRSDNAITRTRRLITSGYIDRRYRAGRGVAVFGASVILSLLPMFRRRIDRRMRYLPRLEPDARLLDVGCGDAKFIEHASSLGWNASGVDPDPINVKNARERNLDVQLGGVEIFKDLGRFDAVTLSHVIEHVHNPGAVLKAVYSILKPGGFLYIDTPNIRALSHSRYGECWRGLEPPRHLAIFSWSSLEYLLSECGFSIDRRVPRYEMYSSMVAKSRAISMNRDPYGEPVLLIDRLSGAIAYVKSIMNYNASEFITLTASRPEERA
jgi:2-polyprenyl-3-methyl-5-hydroxy-6-metoxy-1,4-benzoquinol methylase